MKLPFGYEIIFGKVKIPQETQRDLLDAVNEVNTLWTQARAQKLYLSLWLDWEKKELLVTTIDRKKVADEPVEPKKRGHKVATKPAITLGSVN
jgi:hypothetical protein